MIFHLPAIVDKTYAPLGVAVGQLTEDHNHGMIVGVPFVVEAWGGGESCYRDCYQALSWERKDLQLVGQIRTDISFVIPLYRCRTSL